MSEKSRILWKNFETFTEISYVMRAGFGTYKFYKIPTGEELHFRAESVAEHSGRMANLLIDIMLLYPGFFHGFDKTRIIKVAICHDFAESVVGDVPDDGSEEHESKLYLEKEFFKNFYSSYPASIQFDLVKLYSDFEQNSSIIGSAIKMVDKMDAIGKLLIFEKNGIRSSIDNLDHPSERDLRYASEIQSKNCTDIWARNLQELFTLNVNMKPLEQIAIDFLKEGCRSAKREWFPFWNVV